MRLDLRHLGEDQHIYIYMYVYMQAGSFKTPMHLAAVYIRMVFTHCCGGRQGHLCAVEVRPCRALFLALLNYAEGIRILEGSSALSSLSQHGHGHHNIVIDITTLYSISYVVIYRYIGSHCYLETHPTIIVDNQKRHKTWKTL